MIAKKVKRGLRKSDHDGGVLVWTEEVEEEDSELSDDVVTAELLSHVASGLEQDITMTFDAPSLGKDKMMPVLCKKVWMNDEYKVKFRFYEIPMVSQSTVMKYAAWSWRQKKITLSGEVSRKMLNTSPDLVKLGNGNGDLDQYMFKLIVSGYSV